MLKAVLFDVDGTLVDSVGAHARAWVEALAVLKRELGLEAGDLDAETSADDAARSKPHPDIFEAALALLPGVTPEEAMVVGDSPHDARAAARAGMQAIGLLSGGFPEEDLREAGCVAVFRDPAHLLEDFDLSPLGAAGMPD